MHLLRTHAQQQAKQTRNHQPLDVMRITVVQGLPKHLAQAHHVGVSVPEKGRQIAFSLQFIQMRIRRHPRPVDAAHILAPAQYLAHEPLNTGQRRTSFLQRLFRRMQHSARVQQLEVETGG